MAADRLIAVVTTIIIVALELYILFDSLVIHAPIIEVLILMTILIGIAWISRTPPERKARYA